MAIVDPPRSEARDAIAEARDAGIDVKMITGDHAVTAAAIGRELGLAGDVLTGAELDHLDDAALTERLDATTVFARVSPEHKIRLVDLMQRRDAVVAMTGDGVNDAPALKRADIGIAMGITGTEVSKEAATMVLADDNFATIVGAVRQGRTIYDNIVKFVRFQLSTTLGFAAVFLGAALLGIAGGAPFTAIAILWVNIVMDGPPAMALGVDPAAPDVMRRRPRPLGEPILTRPRWTAIVVAATVMAVGTLSVLAFVPGVEPEAGVATVAGTMAFNTFVLFQFFNLLNARSDSLSVVGRHTIANRWLWSSLAGVLALQLAVTHLGPMQRLFDTTSISAAQWAVCVAVASERAGGRGGPQAGDAPSARLPLSRPVGGSPRLAPWRRPCAGEVFLLSPSSPFGPVRLTHAPSAPTNQRNDRRSRTNAATAPGYRAAGSVFVRCRFSPAAVVTHPSLPPPEPTAMIDVFSTNSLTAIEVALDGVAERQRVTAHNIANVNTPGFRSARVEFESELARALEREAAACATSTPPPSGRTRRSTSAATTWPWRRRTASSSPRGSSTRPW